MEILETIKRWKEPPPDSAIRRKNYKAEEILGIFAD
jgi:hypothetical protein